VEVAMQVHLLSSQSSASRSETGHPHHLPDDLSTALREHGHRVEITLLGDALGGNDLTSLRQGASAGRKIAPGFSGPGRVLHALDPVAWAAALTARSLADVCVVLRFNDPTLVPENRAYQACLRAADAIAAAGDEDRRTAVRAGVSNQRALIVPDVVGLPAEPSASSMLHPGQSILTLSGIGPRSGIETLLTALRWAPDRELVVAGPGSPAEAAYFRAQAERLDLSDRAHWRGWVGRAETIRLIDAAAVVVLPSPTIGVTCAIEAMARGRAVVTVSGGAASDVVVDGVTGSVLPAGHPELLGRTLGSMLTNRFQLEAMGLAGRERALTRYAQDRAVQATEQAYRVALGAT
jgi:glycosyltransferase involved in cell wall biosynthesis